MKSEKWVTVENLEKKLLKGSRVEELAFIPPPQMRYGGASVVWETAVAVCRAARMMGKKRRRKRNVAVRSVGNMSVRYTLEIKRRSTGVYI
jgi:hypothetical protein